MGQSDDDDMTFSQVIAALNEPEETDEEEVDEVVEGQQPVGQAIDFSNLPGSLRQHISELTTYSDYMVIHGDIENAGFVCRLLSVDDRPDMYIYQSSYQCTFMASDNSDGYTINNFSAMVESLFRTLHRARLEWVESSYGVQQQGDESFSISFIVEHRAEKDAQVSIDLTPLSAANEESTIASISDVLISFLQSATKEEDVGTFEVTVVLKQEKNFNLGHAYTPTITKRDFESKALTSKNMRHGYCSALPEYTGLLLCKCLLRHSAQHVC